MGTFQRLIEAVRMLVLLLAVSLAAMPTVGSAATPAGLFLDQTNKLNSASLARDAAGGLHLAFAAYGQEATGQEPAHYARGAPAPRTGA